MNLGSRHIVLEQLHPFMPVPWVDLLRVQLLLVSVCFISDIKDGIHETLAKCGVIGCLLQLAIFVHLRRANRSLVDQSVGLHLHCFEHLLLFIDGQISVKLLSLLILLLAKLSVLDDDFLALVGPPSFIIKFLFLV